MKHLKMYEEITFNEDDWDYMEEDTTELEDYIKVKRPKFYKFLVDNNCLEEWINDCYDLSKEHTMDHVKYTKDKQLISGLFGWDKTPEYESDNEYWTRLNNKWNKMNV